MVIEKGLFIKYYDTPFIQNDDIPLFNYTYYIFSWM